MCVLVLECMGAVCVVCWVCVFECELALARVLVLVCAECVVDRGPLRGDSEWGRDAAPGDCLST